MKITKVFLMILSLVLVCSSIAYATSFSIKTTAVENKILIDEKASFIISITNLGETTDTYKLSLGIDWGALTDPPKDWISGVDVEPQKIVNVSLSLTPSKDLPIGWCHKVKLTVKSQKTQEAADEILDICISSGIGMQNQYAPGASIADITIEPKHIDPRENFVITLYLKNGNRLNLSGLKIKMDSDVINKEDIITLNPLEQKALKYVFGIDPYTAPRTDELKVSLVWGDAIINVQKESYDIAGYSTFTSSKETKKQFLKNIDYYTITNDGNVKKTESFKVKISALYWLFVATNPKAKVVSEDNIRYLKWDLTLEPQEKATIRVVTTYRPFWSITALIIIAIIAYYIFRSPIVIRKRAVVVATEEGGISELKVIISVRNRSNKTFDDVRIIDRVSNIAEVLKEHYLGTLAPSKVLYDTKKGTILKWDLDTIDKYEERIITYKIKSKLSVIGGFNLKPTIVKFRDTSGKDYFSRSNSVTIG